jgi:cobaltochelatase CobS
MNTIFALNAGLSSLVSQLQGKASKFPASSVSKRRLLEVASKLMDSEELSINDMSLAIVALEKADQISLPSDYFLLSSLFMQLFCLVLKEEKPISQPKPSIPAPQPAGSAPDSNAASRIGIAVLDALAGEMGSLSRKVAQAVTREELTSFAETISETMAQLASQKPGPSSALNITVNGVQPAQVEGYLHPQFPVLLACCANRINVMLVGPAGTGKTTMGKQVAQALNISRVVAQSFCAQTPESRLFGYQDANGNYVRTQFRECYEHGGVYILDEMDSASPNVLTALNAAIDNGSCTFPDATIHRHADFIVIACANTYGNGADRQYVGRAQLDASTLNRFAKLSVGYDESLDHRLAGLPFSTSHLKTLTLVKESDRLPLQQAWCNAILAARECVATNGIRATISPRQTRDGVKLLLSGVEWASVVQMLVLDGLAKIDQEKISHVMRKPK